MYYRMGIGKIEIGIKGKHEERRYGVEFTKLKFRSIIETRTKIFL